MPYTFLDFAYEVLLLSEVPLTFQNIWQFGVEKGLDNKLQTKGKTPWASVAAQLYVDIRDNENSRFIKTGKRPTLFFLKEKAHKIKPGIIESTPKAINKITSAKKIFPERTLHPLLNYYTANTLFKPAKSIYTKTIFHEKSNKTGYNQWVYPDIVGFYMPINDWNTEVIELNRISDNNSLQLYSFELKINLNRNTYRESFFQAVSNSSWAHEGYLVTAEIEPDDELLAELKRLSSSFGIGIIKLELADIDSSYILYPAKIRETLDWETLNKLCELNEDFKKFIQDVKIDFEGKRIHKSEYDEVHKDIYTYIKEVLKVSPAE